MADNLQIISLSKDNKELLTDFNHLLPANMSDAMSIWKFVGAIYDDTPCGILAYILEDETIIPWIYVDEDFRRRQVGTQMFMYLQNELEDKLLFTGFSCEIVIDYDGGGLDLIGFFESIDAVDIAPKYCIYEVTPDIYKKTIAEHSIFNNPQKIMPSLLSDLPNYQIISFRNNPKVKERYHVDQISKWGESIDNDLSICIVENDEVTSAIVISDMGEDKMSVELLYANGTKSLVELLIAFGKALLNKNNGKSLIFRPVNEKIMELAEGLFPEINVYGEVWEASDF